MEKNPKITVIIPVYKVEEYLDKCVQSVVEQTYKNLEIILVDDGSPDNCPKMCDEWAKKDERIKVIHKENGGLSSARNAGLDIATGDYITFLDSDDFMTPEFSAVCCEIMNEHDIDVLVSQIVGKSQNYTYKCFENGVKKKILFPISACSKIYRKVFLDIHNIRFLEGVYHEDVDFGIKILLAKPSIVLSRYEYYLYNIENNVSITREVNDEKYFKRIKDSIDIIKNLIENNGSNVTSIRYFLEYADIFLYNALRLSIQINEKYLFDSIVQYIKKNKSIFSYPKSFTNRIIWLGWNIMGLKGFLRLVRVVKNKGNNN